jgi:membrane-associated phospholipid phosphatase
MNRLPHVAISAAKIACVLAYFAAWWAIYLFTNERCARSERAVEFSPPMAQTPSVIQPWTAPIYLAAGLLLPLVPFRYYWSWPRLRFVLGCYAVTSALTFACYWLWPMKIVRPDFAGDSLGDRLMREVLVVDGSANCAPSSHVFYAVLSALLIDAAKPHKAIRVAIWVVAATVSATTITTGQHYWIDVPTGIAVAMIGYAIVRWLWPHDASGPTPS